MGHKARYSSGIRAGWKAWIADPPARAKVGAFGGKPRTICPLCGKATLKLHGKDMREIARHDDPSTGKRCAQRQINGGERTTSPPQQRKSPAPNAPKVPTAAAQKAPKPQKAPKEREPRGPLATCPGCKNKKCKFDRHRHHLVGHLTPRGLVCTWHRYLPDQPPPADWPQPLPRRPRA